MNDKEKRHKIIISNFEYKPSSSKMLLSKVMHTTVDDIPVSQMKKNAEIKTEQEGCPFINADATCMDKFNINFCCAKLKAVQVHDSSPENKKKLTTAIQKFKDDEHWPLPTKAGEERRTCQDRAQMAALTDGSAHNLFYYGDDLPVLYEAYCDMSLKLAGIGISVLALAATML